MIKNLEMLVSKSPQDVQASQIVSLGVKQSVSRTFADSDATPLSRIQTAAAASRGAQRTCPVGQHSQGATTALFVVVTGLLQFAFRVLKEQILPRIRDVAIQPGPLGVRVQALITVSQVLPVMIEFGMIDIPCGRSFRFLIQRPCWTLYSALLRAPSRSNLRAG